MRADWIDGKFEFHRDDEGSVTVVENLQGALPHMVVIPARVWGQAWPRMVSLSEFRRLENSEDVP